MLLNFFFQTDEEGIEVEPEIEEDVSEIEDNNPDFDPDHHETEQSTARKRPLRKRHLGRGHLR